MKILLLSLVLLTLIGCTPDPNRTREPITVRDVNGVCWKIEPAYIIGDTHYGPAVTFLKVPCP